MKDFIEMQIIGAVKELLAGRVNELLCDSEFTIPVIEFGGYCGSSVVKPEIILGFCERTEKERIIQVDAYSLTVSFSLPEMPESELCCYAYVGAVGKVVFDNPTLGGIVDRAVVVEKKFIPPKKPHCGDGWELVLTIRLTVEQ